MTTNYKIAAYEVGGVELGYPQEIVLSVENIVTTTPLYGQTDLIGILEYLRVLGNPLEINSTTTFSRTATTMAVITGFTVTPPAGTYKVDFVSTVYTQAAVITLGAEARAQLQLYVGGSAVVGTVTDVSGANSYHSAKLMDVVSVNGSQAIDVRAALVSGASMSVGNRIMLLTKVG